MPKVIELSERWLVLDKPPGWLTIPGRDPSAVGVLSEWAREHYSPLWVVHRLDQETSGVVLFARTAEAHQLANTWFETRKAKKIYYCLAQGQPETPVFKVNEPVGGAPSLTQVEVMEKYPVGFFAKIFPMTGRRHQIRIHLANRGHPLLGDVRYHGPREISWDGQSLIIPRVALHAARLELPTGEVFESSLPEDFTCWRDQLIKWKKDSRV